MGDDEFSRTIKIKNRLTDFPFDGIIAVFIKISTKIKLPPSGAAGSDVRKKYDKILLKYTKVEGGVRKWNAKALKVWTDWETGIKKVINELNNRFYLQTGKNDHDFKNTYIFLFPVTESDKHATAHYAIDITMDDSDDITRGTPLELGNEVSKHWLANYILGVDDGRVKAFFRRILGKDKPGKSNVKFVKTWFDAKLDEMGMDKNFTLKGS
jgi:hypothetical protein